MCIPAGKTCKSHTVRKGEYLSKIAGMYSTTVEALVALNVWLQKEV